MKNFITILSIATIILSSCTSQKNGLAIKRKYNKGYYIAHNHKKSNEAVKQTNTDKAVVIVEDKNSVVAELPAVKTIINTNVDEIKVENIPTKINEVKHNTILTDSKIVTASSGSAQIKPVHKVVSVQKKESKSSSDSDSQLILLVILSIFPFLALLAMYLKDGKQITLNFWVDLILHLTFIGYIIFALLVVFDIVNLA
jgi:hypothetical protein